MNRDLPHDEQIERAERVGKYRADGFSIGESLAKVAAEGNFASRTVRRAWDYQQSFRLIPASKQAEVAQLINEKRVNVKDVLKLAKQPQSQVERSIDGWLHEKTDAWGNRIHSGAAAINAVLLAADAEISENEIAAKIRELGLPEREAIAQHLWQLKQKGLVMKTPSGGYVRTSENIAPLKADVGLANDPAEAVPYTPDKIDRRRLVQRTICERRGQQQFRDALRKRYGDRCMVTGCGAMDVVEAAHINPYRGENDNHATNGLLLRADIHTLFDLDLLGIEPAQLRIELHPSLCGDYMELGGKQLICDTDKQPSKEALEGRYGDFCTKRPMS